MTLEELRTAHSHSFANRSEVDRSARCGCFYCFKTFAPMEIEHWAHDNGGDTAICPGCFIDSVLGDASGMPVAKPEFLSEMHQFWFGEDARARQ